MNMDNSNQTTTTTTSFNQDAANQPLQPSFLAEHYTLLAASMIVASAILVVVSFWLREYCYDSFGIECCSGSISTARRREIRRNHLRALQLQRQMERDMQDSSVTIQKERKRVYGLFLQKFSKVSRCTITMKELL